MLTRTFPLLAIIWSSGCIPVPVNHTYSPRTVGVLTSEGEPVSGALVYRTRAGRGVPDPCRTSTKDTLSTSTSGGFDLPPASRITLDFATLAIQEPMPQIWTMCFVVSSDTLSSREVLMWPKSSVLLSCETTKLETGGTCDFVKSCPSLEEEKCTIDPP